MFRRTRALFSRPSSRITSNNRIDRTKRLYLQGLEERTVPTVYPVTNLLDDGSAGSLRGAILLANADATAGPHTVDATGVMGTISLLTGQIPVNNTAIQDIIINGPGSGKLTVSGTGIASATNRIFNNTGTAAVTVSGMTLTGANTTTGNNGAGISSGVGNLSLSDVIFRGNRTAAAGAALSVVANSSTVVTLTGCQFNFNVNSGTSVGGAVLIGTVAGTGAASVTVTSCTFNFNSSGGSGAGMYVNSTAGTTALAISKSNFNLNSGTSGVSVFVNGSPASVDVDQSNFVGNVGTSNAGALYFASNPTTIDIQDSRFVNNTGSSGGAIYYSASPPSVTVNNSVFSGNTATSTHGGGMYFFTGGSATITNSTFDNNLSGTGGDGGAIAIWTASVQVTNSTLTGNTARGGAGGGAISVRSSAGVFNLDNSTIVGNVNTGGTTGGGGVRIASATTVSTFNSSIIAKNTSAVGGADIQGSVAINIAGMDNLVGVGDTGGFTLTGAPNQTGTKASPLDPLLAPLGNYGGPMMTMPPVAGSPALEKGGNALALADDQRGAGFPRVVGALTDVGAVESPTAQPSIIFAGPGIVTTPGGTPNTVKVTYSDLVGIDVSTIDAGDIKITAPDGSNVPVTGASVDIMTNGSPRVATYTFTIPGGSWDFGDSGVYTVTQVATQVADIDGSTTYAGAGIVGGFAATVGQIFTVNATTDTGAGAGTFGDLRYCINASNATPGFPDVINFDGAVFTAGTTITIASALPAISDSVAINGPGVANLKILGSGKAGFVVSANKTVSISNMEINGLSSTVVGGAFSVSAGAVLNVSGMVFSGNKTSSTTGGGVFGLLGANTKVTVDASTFTGNSVTGAGGDGGVVRGTTNSFFTATNSTFSGNTTTDDGGAIYLTGATLNVLGCTFSSNTTAKAAGNDGGAITYTGTVPATAGGGFVIRNSTFSGNSASSGGAMLLAGAMSGTATITNTTFTLNGFTSVTGNGGAINRQGGTPVFESVIISGNSSAAPAANGTDLFSAAAVTMNTSAIGTSLGFTVGSGSGNFIGTPVALGALANNGGPTLTHLPASGSFVRNNGSNPAGLATDQTGVARTAQLFTDIGAVESVDIAPVFHMTPIPAILVGGATPNQVVITYSDDNAIDYLSIDAGDITITGPGGAVTVTAASVDVMADGPNRIATYTFTPPGGTWDGADNGIYTVSILGTQVADKDGTVLYVSASVAGTFVVGVPASYVVDNTGDVNDGDYSAGKFTLREAVALANLLAASPDTITFGGAAFAGAATITLATELPINGNLTITGTGSSNLTISGNNAVRIFNYTDASQVATFNLNNLRLFGGKAATLGGGAILNSSGETLNITNCVIEGNTATTNNGGAINLPAGGAVTIASSTFLNNATVAGPGGAIDGNAGGGKLTITESTFTGNKAPGSRGGVISVATFTTSISRSTFSGNTAANGGALSFYGTVSTTIDNSTISSNTATTSGGGIQVQSGGVATLAVRNSTITANTATTSGGGIARTSGTWTINLYSSIVYGNMGGTTLSPDLFTALDVIANFSSIGDSTGVTTFTADATTTALLGQNPLLGPLQNNGGPTLTHALTPGTPVLNMGDNAVGMYANDQRGAGFPRVLAGTPDIGAFEGVDASPAGTWTPIGPIVTPGATPNQIVVSWSDDVAINWTTLGVDDITIKAPDGSFLTITGAVPSQMSNGTPISVTYTFTVPGGAWGSTFDSGIYTVSTVAGNVADSGGSLNKAVTLGTFLVDLPANIVVDEATDIDDGDFSVGKRSFREAVARANTTTSTDTISFSAAVFNVAKSIVQTTEIKITQPLSVVGPAAALTFDATGNAGVRLLNIDVPAATNSAISISNLTLKGGSNTTGSIILNVDEDLALTNVTVTGGTASAAIYTQLAVANLTLNNCSLTNNSSTSGGGAIRVQPSGATTIVTINNSTLSGNTSSGAGGAIYFNFGGTLTVTGSTFAANKGGSGGAIGLWNAAGTFTNSTFFGNVGTTGGVINLQSTGATATFNNCTVSGNSATTGGGLAKGSSAAGDFTLDSTIVAKNTNTGATSPDIYYVAAGTVNGDYSLIGVSDLTGTAVTFAGANNKMGTGAAPLDPLLGTLSNNGGPTQTMLPAFGSPAIKAGSNPLTLTTDQRGVGFPRELTPGMPNIGAVEGFQSAPSAKLTPLGPIVTVGPTPDTVVVTYSDNNAVDWTTIDISDIEILDPLAAPLAITSVSVDFMSNGTPRVATYKFSVPGGGWDFTDNGKYTVNMKASQVADLDPLFVPAGTLGTFTVGIPAKYVVDITADEDDGNFAAGDLSLREAIKLSNGAASADSITFDPIVFASAQTITLTLGELAISDAVTITGTGSSLLTVSGGGASRVFNIATAATFAAISISGMTITGGSSTTDGGGITIADEDVTLTNVKVIGNTTTTEGGGINVSTASGKLTLIDCVVSNNTATNGSQDGGGINFDVTATNAASQVLTVVRSTISGNAAGDDGGGIYFFSGGTLNMVDSTVSGNVATGDFGGGIYLFSTIATLTNSTVSGNTASVTGGGIAVLYNTNLTVNNSTIVGNAGGTGGGGIGKNTGTPTVTLDSSIVAKNTGTAAPDIQGAATIDYCLIGEDTGATLTDTNGKSLIGTMATPINPLVGPLANNGGPTLTHALLAGSPAINAGQNTLTLSFDQRGTGFNRSVGLTDIGAFEVQPAAPAAKVTGVSINSKGLTAAQKAQRSRVTDVAIAFDSKVSFAGTPEAAFTLNRVSPGAGSVTLAASVDNSGPGTIVTLTFIGGTVDNISLQDGRYALHAVATQFTGSGLDGDGNGTGGDDFLFDQAAPPTALDTAKVFRLFGDYNGDGTVAANDFIQFRLALGGADPIFDFDNDGAVATSDFIQFRLRFGGSI